MVVRVVGEPPELGFEPQDHLEIGTRAGADRHGERGARRPARGSPT